MTGHLSEADPQQWTINVPMVMLDTAGKPRPWTLNDRPHWTKARMNAQMIRNDVTWRAKQQHLPALEHITVQLHYAPGDNRRRDEDNLVITAKHALDGIVRAGVVGDDSPQFVTHLMPAIHGGKGMRQLWLVVAATPRPEIEETPK